MPEEHSADLRERVLRRVAQKDDLDAAAREFGLPPDVVFGWLKARADGAPPPASRSSRNPPVTDGATAATDADWPVIASFYGALSVPTLVLFTMGHVRPSLEAQRACLPVWVLLGAGVFAWLLYIHNRGLQARGRELGIGPRLLIAALFAVLSALSAWVMSLALPAIPHRLTSTPVEVRTVVVDKVIQRGRHTSYCVVVPPFDSRLERFDWCTSLARFQQARIGETIVLHGTTSWFGFKDDHFDLEPGAPAAAAALPSPAMSRPGPPAIVPPFVPHGSPVVAPTPGVAPRPVSGMPPAMPARRDAGQALRVRLGDDLAALRAAYPDAPAPTPFHSGDAANQQVVALPNLGLRLFLGAAATVREVRLDAPFAGTAHGIGIGDTLDTIQRQLGSPGRAIAGQPAPSGSSMLFTTASGDRIRVDFGADQRARTIFLLP